VIEQLDAKQTALLEHVLKNIQYYYSTLYLTRPVYQYPLTLSRLMKLCNRSGHAVSAALRYLANTIPEGSESEPPIYYDRKQAAKNKSHRPYRIYLRKQKYD
jgi:hypothetical protein